MNPPNKPVAPTPIWKQPDEAFFGLRTGWKCSNCGVVRDAGPNDAECGRPACKSKRRKPVELVFNGPGSGDILGEKKDVLRQLCDVNGNERVKIEDNDAADAERYPKIIAVYMGAKYGHLDAGEERPLTPKERAARNQQRRKKLLGKRKQ